MYEKQASPPLRLFSVLFTRQEQNTQRERHDCLTIAL